MDGGEEQHLERTAGLDPLDLWITLHDMHECRVGEGWRFAERHEVDALIDTFQDVSEGRAELLEMLGLMRGFIDRNGTVHRKLEAFEPTGNRERRRAVEKT